MSIIVENKWGWVLDHRTATVLDDKCLANMTSEPGRDVTAIDQNRQFVSCCYKMDLFRIDTPYRMDSQVRDKTAVTQSGVNPSNLTPKRRQRKRKFTMTEGQLLAHSAHEQIRSDLLAAYESLLDLARREVKYLCEQRDADFTDDNNTAARVAARAPDPGQDLAAMCENCTDIGRNREFYFDEDSYIPARVPVNQMWRYVGGVPRIVNLSTGRYVIPPRASFLLSSMAFLPQQHYYTALGKFDLIVMDPPWENRSVKRKKTYYSVRDHDLLTLPIQHLCRPGCLVVVWVTNRQKQIDFVYNSLFPTWNIRPFARWYWLKVTTNGEMVYRFDSPHKKPYESIILGRYQGIEDPESNFSNATESSAEHGNLNIPSDNDIKLDSDACSAKPGYLGMDEDRKLAALTTDTDTASEPAIQGNMGACPGAPNIATDAASEVASQGNKHACPGAPNIATVACEIASRGNIGHSSVPHNIARDTSATRELDRENDDVTISNNNTKDSDTTALNIVERDKRGSPAAFSIATDTDANTDDITLDSQEINTIASPATYNIATDNTTLDSDETHMATDNGCETEEAFTESNVTEVAAGLHSEIPDGRVIISVPCSIHSKKPPLFDVVKKYLPSSPDCLEMFARNLTVGWTSWGNEVLEHQLTHYYESVG